MNQNQLRTAIANTYDPSRIIQKEILATSYPIHASRLPDLRKIAKTYGNDLGVLNGYSLKSYEDVMMYGLILCAKKRSDDQFIAYFDAYLPYVDSWCYCDSIFKGYRWFTMELLNHYRYLLTSFNPFEVRLYLNMLLQANRYLPLDLIDEMATIDNHSYVVDMMIAWIMQLLLAKDMHQLSRITAYQWEATVVKYAIRKCNESKVFTKEQKQIISKELRQCIKSVY